MSAATEPRLAPGSRPTLAASVALVAACLLLAAAVHLAHQQYLATTWEYQGFKYARPALLDIVVAVLLIAIPAAVAPTAIEKPSQMIAASLFCILYVPTIVITLCLVDGGTAKYGPLLASFAVGMLPILLVARLPSRSTAPIVVGSGLPSTSFMRAIEGIWWVVLAVLIVKQGSVMELSAIDDVYDQRAKGAADSLVIGYAQTYFGSVLSPLLLAYGLTRRRTWHIMLGCAGCLVMYAIDAQKSVLFTPLMMLAIHQFVGRPLLTQYRTPIIAAVLGLLVGGLTGTVSETNFGLVFLVHRMIGVPAVVFSQYYDLFSETGFTWWSHVRGISLFVDPPATFAMDPRWPKLGLIVGERVLEDPDINANASLFAGDGAAAAGLFGVVVIGVACAIWAYAMDRCARRWNPTFTVLCVAPAAMALTNCHLFTMLLSYGGLFFPLLFILYKPPPVDEEVPT